MLAVLALGWLVAGGFFWTVVACGARADARLLGRR
jgi:hypothetical protein